MDTQLFIMIKEIVWLCYKIYYNTNTIKCIKILNSRKIRGMVFTGFLKGTTIPVNTQHQHHRICAILNFTSFFASSWAKSIIQVIRVDTSVQDEDKVRWNVRQVINLWLFIKGYRKQHRINCSCIKSEMSAQ